MTYLVFASLAIAVMVIILLAVFGIRVQRNNIWLIGYLFTLGYSCWIGYLMNVQEIFKMPHLIRTGTVCGYLIVPMLYLYVRSTCYPGIIWQPWYALLFVPSLFFIMDLVPFWLKTAEAKIALFEESMRNLHSLHAFAESWISPRGFHFVFRLLWSIGWFVAILHLIRRNYVLMSSPANYNNRLVFRFMLGLTLLSLPFLLIHLVLILFFTTNYTLSNFTFLLALPLVMAGGYLMFFPQVVYGFQLPSTINATASYYDPVSSSVSGHQQLTGQLTEIPQTDQQQSYLRYEAHLLEYMDMQKPFLNPGLSIHQLAEGSGIPTYILSMLINRHFGQSFNAWLNGYRTDVLKQLLIKEDARNFTIESLGKSAGFGSRVTMIKAFKKLTGLTPGQYLHLQESPGHSGHT